MTNRVRPSRTAHQSSQRTEGSTVYSVTSAPPSLRSDKSERMRRYIFSMSLRTACFAVAVFVSGPTRWVCIVLACLLPYVAVVMANAARSRRVESMPAVPGVGVMPRALTAREDPYVL